MESTQMASYDGNLFEPFVNALSDEAKNRLILIHLIGSHTQYSKRYPSDYEKFTGAEEYEQKIIDTYDNSILYNDFVIDHFFSLLDSYSETHPDIRISALYISDHGENVYDEGAYAGHD